MENSFGLVWPVAIDFGWLWVTLGCFGWLWVPLVLCYFRAIKAIETMSNIATFTISHRLKDDPPSLQLHLCNPVQWEYLIKYRCLKLFSKIRFSNFVCESSNKMQSNSKQVSSAHRSALHVYILQTNRIFPLKPIRTPHSNNFFWVT